MPCHVTRDEPSVGIVTAAGGKSDDYSYGFAFVIGFLSFSSADAQEYQDKYDLDRCFYHDALRQ
jgi:hypothetical protein